MQIRRTTFEDGPGLLDLWLGLNADGQTADPRYQLRPDAEAYARRFIEEHWLGQEADRPTWVATEGADLIGFIATRAAEEHPVLVSVPTLVITDMYVAPAHRRRGVGRALYGAASVYAAARSCRSLEVGTLALDERAVAFWRAVGFDDWRVTLSQDIS